MSRTAPASLVSEFVDAMSTLMPPSQIRSEDVDGYAVDGETPDVLVEPASIEQVQHCLAEAHAGSLAVIALGGGTRLNYGNPPSGYDVALCVRRLDQVVAYEPDDLTVTVEAGVRVDHLADTLRARGQTLPFDPPGSGDGTVGGLISANAFGPLRAAHGTIRDWLIGITVALADGTLVKSGGRVVKNVSGYDLHKLYAGSLGTLGVIVEATLRVAPSPRAESTVAATAESARAAAKLILRARDAGLAVRGAELLSPAASFAVGGDHAWMALFRLGGGDAAVLRSAKELRVLAAAAGGVPREADMGLWDRWRAAFAPTGLSLRASVAPSQVGEAVEVLDRRFAGASSRVSATVAAGMILARLQPTATTRAVALVERARETVGRFGGFVVVDAAPATYKREHDVFGSARPDFALMRRLKEEFDPKRILSPGRFVGRL
jgi:glycolate oxidase FAD binding subunit